MEKEKGVNYSLMCGKCGQILPDSKKESPCFCGNNYPHQIIIAEENQNFQCTHCGCEIKSLCEAKEACRLCYSMNSFRRILKCGEDFYYRPNLGLSK